MVSRYRRTKAFCNFPVKSQCFSGPVFWSCDFLKFFSYRSLVFFNFVFSLAIAFPSYFIEVAPLLNVFFSHLHKMGTLKRVLTGRRFFPRWHKVSCSISWNIGLFYREISEHISQWLISFLFSNLRGAFFRFSP